MLQLKIILCIMTLIYLTEVTTTRSLFESSQITLTEAVFAFGGGFAGGLISHVAYQTQFIVSTLNELAQTALSCFKKIVNLPKNWFI